MAERSIPIKYPDDHRRQKQFERDTRARRARNREKNAQKKHERDTLAAAQEAAAGETDFERLVKVQQQLMDKDEEDIAEAERLAAAGVKGREVRAQKYAKQSLSARENLVKAFDLMGGVAGLVVWGRQNTTEFYRIWSRLIPRESVELSASLPLESLLEKLSGHGNEGMSVADAAWQVGADLLEEGRKKAAEEDLLSARPEDIN